MGRLLPRISSWAALTLCADGIVRSAGDQCSTICDLIKAEVSSSEACAKSRKSLPRPKIGRVCQEGFDEAFNLTCRELCSFHGTSRLVPSHLGGACDKRGMQRNVQQPSIPTVVPSFERPSNMQHDAFHRKREVPRPAVHRACVDGFNAGLAATTTLVTKRIESMDDDARNSFMQNNANLLKEADAERDTSKEVAKARDAQQVQQREEAQESARKAFEEKSAEVQREKEALSKKQELETTRVAEEAEHNLKQAEQERQARMSERIKAADPKDTKEDTGVDSSAATTDRSGTAAAHSRLQRIIPEETRKDAPISGAKDFSGAGAGGAHYPELPWAVQAMGVEAEKAWVPVEERELESRESAEATPTGEMLEEALTPGKRTQGLQSALEDYDTHEVNALPAVVVEKEAYAGLKDERTIGVRNDPTYRDMAESVKGLEVPLKKERASSEAVDGQAGLEPDLERDATSEDDAAIALSNDRRQQSIRMSVKGLEFPLAQEGAPSEALNGQAGSEADLERGATSEKSAGVELSNSGWHQKEVAATGAVLAKRGALDDGLKYTGGAFQQSPAETGLDAGSENSTVTNLANDRVFLEAFMQEHVQGSEAPLVQQDGPASNFDDPDDESATA
ncbi:unnamed protein product [Ectocarpus sp. CCAP 1310/34]|nr:unnamed protein product [Ectocarpus sp. CCAP 1310/34]